MPPSITIHRLAPTEQGREAAWANALQAFTERDKTRFGEPGHQPGHQTTTLKHDGPASVYRTTLLGCDLALKRLALSSPTARLKNFLHLSRSFRQWRGAGLLLSASIDTAAPILLATQRSSPPCEFIATEFIQGPTLLSLFAQGLFTPALSAALGQHLARVTRAAHLFNRDHKPSNLIVTQPDPQPHPHCGTPDACRIIVLDTVGIRRISPASHLRFAARMLASLIIEPTGCGHPPPESFIHDIATNYTNDKPDAARLTQTALHIRATHGDSTPRVSPL